MSALLMKRRILGLLLLAVFAGTGLVVRLCFLQIYQNHFFQGKALEQRLLSIPVDALRGTIFDRNGIPLAVSVSAHAVYAIPLQITEKEETAKKVAEVLDLDYNFVLRRIKRSTSSEWLTKRASLEQVQKLFALSLLGIGVVEHPLRYYPYGSVAPQVLGIVGVDNVGLEGLELYYDRYLRGTSGATSFERDALGKQIKEGVTEYTLGQRGFDVYLTLDYYLQMIAQQEVTKAAQETGSRLALLVLMCPKTGEILANAVYPSYDSRSYQQYPQENRRNIAVTDTYEPGSTFKAVTALAAFDAGVASMDTFFTDPGFIRVSGWTVRCWHRGGHGTQSFVETLENSCNPFYAKLGIDLGPERFYSYLRSYNFAEKMGVDFPGEAKGVLRPPSSSVPLVTWANIGFGQGMTLTPLQLLAAFSAIANEGVYHVPHYVKEIHTDREVVAPASKEGRRIAPVVVANQIREALRSVIEHGSGKRADAPGYQVAGKTGTAQVVEHGRYSHSKTITSFAGFAPYDDPKVAGLLVLWEPQGAFFGGIIAAPVFYQVIERIMPYLGVKRKTEESSSSYLLLPSVEGLPLEEGVLLLQREGFSVQIVGEGEEIIGQVPKAGAKVGHGTKVLIYLQSLEPSVDAILPCPYGV